MRSARLLGQGDIRCVSHVVKLIWHRSSSARRGEPFWIHAVAQKSRPQMRISNGTGAVDIRPGTGARPNLRAFLVSSGVTLMNHLTQYRGTQPMPPMVGSCQC